jgi:hypothetical protein
VFTWCGETVLEAPVEFPYDHGELPFVPLNLLPAVGGDPQGRTWVTDLIGPQRDYNDARSREATIRRTLTPKILGATGSIDPNRMNSRVEFIPYNPIGGKPEFFLPDGRWMAQFEQSMNRTDQEMGDRAGQQDVSQGKAASSAPAAGILALQEADETKLAISAVELAATIECLGLQILNLVKQFWTEERVVRTWSRDGLLEVGHFQGADVGQQLDVHISAESSLPKSKTARTQLAIDLRTSGVITDDRDFVRMLDLPGTDYLVETINRDAKQASREHGHLLRGEPVQVRSWHNHAAHLNEHNDFRKTEEYDNLSPEEKAHFDAHCDVHYALELAKAMTPVPPGSPQEKQLEEQANANPAGINGQPVDPMTGAPSDPNAIGGLSGNLGAVAQAQQTPIGGVGQPGPVPGASLDQQMYAEGN